MRPRLLWRLVVIQFVLLRHGLDEIVLALKIFRPIRFLKFASPWYWFSNNRQRTRGERLVAALEDLGPIFVKFGQMLSTRRDLLPPDLAEALSALQDRVRPFPAEVARARIEAALGASVTEHFACFEAEPLASASIAQVHAATLDDGQEVIVKITRPGIHRRIRSDLEILYTVARLAERYWSEGPRLHPVEVVTEFDKTLMNELDLQREAANAAELKRQFEGSPMLYVPAVYWDWCRTDVLVQERIHGIPIARTDLLRAANVNMQRLAERGVEVFFTQVFKHNFFHADMHPGNIFVDASDPEQPRYMAVDFGIVGSLMPEDQRYLAENFHAFFNRDYRRVAELHVESGWVPNTTRVEEFEAAIRTVCEPIFQKPLREISFGHFLLRLFQVARQFDMEVQPQLVLLQKTLLAIEGLGRELYPDLDLWQTAKPFIERWMRERIGPKAFLERFKDELPYLNQHLSELPRLSIQAMQQVHRQSEILEGQRRELVSLRHEAHRDRARNRLTLIGALLLVVFLATQGGRIEQEGITALSWIGWAELVGAASFLFAALRR
ncbi:ubiquinone biosynthesis regulatory protein kinase UbiB [Guyparkeria sp. SCN-R1]|uniref:ubiquinone biosynthesis regulatory protein kinase UbiB n=1 Tax=unclassified Guyparkeria TaxID=2626246 RepID=UPI000F648AA0|nr:ubiquinone biosynthesis regulatory protein kinase UbiB [Guyparkeria sp. SCN-R1]RRQ20524.1 ubiquinone biosynthesis regulatory protein kinase UbiB [Guyparkeria sp. SCN-R1]